MIECDQMLIGVIWGKKGEPLLLGEGLRTATDLEANATKNLSTATKKIIGGSAAT